MKREHNKRFGAGKANQEREKRLLQDLFRTRQRKTKDVDENEHRHFTEKREKRKQNKKRDNMKREHNELFFYESSMLKPMLHIVGWQTQ